MKFDINQLTDAILDYMNKNEVKNPMEFPTLAFFKAVSESGLSDVLNLKLAADTDGKLKIIQLKDRHNSNYLDIAIKDPSVPDPADDPKNKPINPYGQKQDADIITLNSNNDSSFDKRVLMKRENTTQSVLETILTNEMKEKRLNIYKVLAKYDTLSEIADNITDYETMIHFDDRKLHHLSQAIYSYKQYQESLSDHVNKSDEVVIPSVLNKHLQNTLNSLISLSEKREQQSTNPHNNVDQLADTIKGVVSFSAPSLLLGADTFKMTGINKHVKLNNENMSGVSLGHSLLNTIKENVDKGTLDNIIDDIYKNHISQDLQQEYALKLRMFTRQKTIEDRLENPDVNNFVEELKIKYPNVFKDNELFSYRSGVLTDKSSYSNIHDVFNTFQLNDEKTKQNILSEFTDTYLLKDNFFYNISPEEDCVRLIGETDASVKHLITGVIDVFGDKKNQDMKVFKVASFILLNKEDNQFNRMACEHLFSYCAKNKLALYMWNEKPKDELDRAYDTLLEVAEDYKDKVYFIENSQRYDKVQNMCGCKTDMPTFVKNMNDPNFEKQDYTVTHGMKY